MDFTLIASLLTAAGSGGLLGYVVGSAKAKRLTRNLAAINESYDILSDGAARVHRENVALKAEAATMRAQLEKVHAQRVAAAAKATAASQAKAKATRAAAVDKTAAALTTARLRPRADVVAPVAAERAARLSGAGAAAKQG